MVTKIARNIYLLFISVFVLGAFTQIFFVGMSVLAGTPSWEEHRGLGGLLGLLLLLTLPIMYVAKMPRPFKPMTWAMFLIFVVMVFALGARGTEMAVISAFHPVLAVGLIALCVRMPVQVWRLLREGEPEAAMARTAAATD